MVTGDAYTDADVLDQKLTSSDSSITMTVTGNQVDMTVTNPANYKVKVNSSDATANYLENKVVGVNDPTWGLATYISTQPDDSAVAAMATVGNPALFVQQWMNYVASDPTALVQFANLVGISAAVPGLPIDDLVVELNGGNYLLTWTAQTGNSQQAKWRQRGTVVWAITSFTPANPLSDVAVTTTAAIATVNTPFQFQVDTIYSTGLIGSNVYENIQYECQSLSYTVLAGVISVSQTVLPHVDTITYYLYNSGPTLVETITTTGSSPAVAFAAVASGTYSVRWVMTTLINGTNLSSDDVSQIGTYCSQAGVVVP